MQTVRCFAVVFLLSVGMAAQSTPPSSAEANSGTPASSTATPPGDSTHLVLVEAPKPVYPLDARRLQTQGQVWVHLVIDEKGDVIKAEPVSGDSLLVAAAVDAMKHWKFQPYIKDGHPVQVSTKMHYDFAFTDKVFDKPAPASSVAASESADATNKNSTENSDAAQAGGQKVQRIRVSQSVSQGMMLHQVAPVYPAAARYSHIQGSVVLRAVIGKDGRIQSLKAVSSPSQDLTDAAVGAVQQWRYRPYTLNGEPVEVDTQIVVNFKLQ